LRRGRGTSLQFDDPAFELRDPARQFGQLSF
jgi:hypothetical protein